MGSAVIVARVPRVLFVHHECVLEIDIGIAAGHWAVVHRASASHLVEIVFDKGVLELAKNFVLKHEGRHSAALCRRLAALCRRLAALRRRLAALRRRLAALRRRLARRLALRHRRPATRRGLVVEMPALWELRLDERKVAHAFP